VKKTEREAEDVQKYLLVKSGKILFLSTKAKDAFIPGF
jgi:hypothetical protein